MSCRRGQEVARRAPEGRARPSDLNQVEAFATDATSYPCQRAVFLRGCRAPAPRSAVMTSIFRESIMRRHLVALLFLSLIVASLDVRAQSAAGIRWTAPAGWKTEAARPMRAATYTIPSAAGAGQIGRASCRRSG